jgi:lipoprotein-anchoring transpeptidase ErfK/SrfK
MRFSWAVVPAAAVAIFASAAPAYAAKVESLQKLGRESYYAFVEQKVPAKAEPKDSAKTVGKLTTKTGEGTDDLVLVLARTTDEEEQVWLKVRLPIRPNGTTGWVREEALSSLQPVDTWLKISTKTYRATLIKKGKKVWSSPIGVGQNQWPTPKGQFYIRAKLTGYKNPVYGPLAFVTSATSPTLTDWPGGGIVGIHGTNQPGLIPGKISHGCVRVPNANILKLNKLMKVGTPLTVT